MGLTLLERQQARWERAQRLVEMRAQGVPYRDIGAAHGIGARTAKEIIDTQLRYERRHGTRQPVEVWPQNA